MRSYFVLGSFTDNAGLAPVLRVVPETRALARTAMTALLAGPNEAELAARPAMYTSIPEGTTLVDLSIENGTATVDLTAPDVPAATFRRGMAPAQIVYTLTQFPTIREVRIEIDGRAIGTSDRADHRNQGVLPAIFVDRPAWGAASENPARVSGVANVFEARLVVQLRNARGRVLVERTVTATCGTGCWGRFAVTLGYDVSRAQQGSLRVFSRSARDGSPENVTRYPVWLTPRQR